MGVSHWLFFQPFVTELVKRGHNVTLLSYFGISAAEVQTRANYREFLFENHANLTNTFDLQVSRMSFGVPIQGRIISDK